MKKCVVLLSGGIDSATTLAVARSQGFAAYAISFNYGQRHLVELRCAQRVAAALGASEHMIMEVDMRTIGASALTATIEVPKGRSLDEISHDIPVTYVPARNTVFLSLALSWAEALEAYDIFIGVNSLDYSGYPDCRPEFIQAFETMANLGTRAGVEGRRFHIQTPLIALTKGEIIRLGLGLGVDYSLTHSCYDPDADGRPCGTCDSCVLRRKGFLEAGVTEPLTSDL
ncbi:MAG: 7-cyano-7-deazaguanine synthase QueC [Thermodesulfobacteriota bacterium]